LENFYLEGGEDGKNNIKTNIMEMGYEDRMWIDLTQDFAEWR